MGCHPISRVGLLTRDHHLTCGAMVPFGMASPRQRHLVLTPISRPDGGHDAATLPATDNGRGSGSRLPGNAHTSGPGVATPVAPSRDSSGAVTG
jgi:hypothetical protein